jgi:hypothetical protein
MKKITAVQWLVDYCDREVGYIPIKIIEQAKAMEKEQIEYAHVMGGDGEIEAEKYYKEKYQSNEI